nr:flavodoxin domain-containing protein [Thalassolituus oleivorans]
MQRIGLIYGTDTGNTEEIAYLLQEKIDWAVVEIHNIASCAPEDIAQYQTLILGIPTWDFGGIQADWEDFWPILEDMSLPIKRLPFMVWVISSVTVITFWMLWDYCTMPCAIVGQP